MVMNEAEVAVAGGLSVFTLQPVSLFGLDHFGRHTLEQVGRQPSKFRGVVSLCELDHQRGTLGDGRSGQIVGQVGQHGSDRLRLRR